MSITNKEIALRATRALALLKEATVISKKDGSRLTEDERFFVFLCGNWYFVSLINDTGEKNIDDGIRFEIMENSSRNGAKGYVSMKEFVNGASSYIRYLLSTFPSSLQEKYNSFCIKHEFSKYPTLLDDIESYLRNVDFDWLVETHYRDYICLDPVRNKIQAQSVSKSITGEQLGCKTNSKKQEKGGIGCSLVILLVAAIGFLACSFIK